ncbi:ubiquitin-like domain protein [Faustovirus]|nr:hypothetical protein F-LCD7_0259 [Faustovirus]QJX72024.1 ubiquitin-like domain protein [Faustovirus]QJX73015.1 ubiquitin-like domain protein [Faustovirus]QJX73522.1 ubiquitin-like domain protein [Faustovirus]QJX74028.1 hypothetical protein F-E9_274 [Faustovirus]
MQIFTRGLYKGTFNVSGNTAFCDFIRAVVARLPALKLDDVYVIYNGRCIDTASHTTLAECGLKECATIDINGRLRSNCDKCGVNKKIALIK